MGLLTHSIRSLLDRVGVRVPLVTSMGSPGDARSKCCRKLARVLRKILAANSLVNIYVDLPAMLLRFSFLVFSKLRLFSNLVVLGNSCFSLNLVTVSYRLLVAVQSRIRVLVG